MNTNTNLKTKLQIFMKTRNGMIVMFIGLFVIAVGFSWVLFSFILKPAVVTTANVNSTRTKIDPKAPKTEACPINGQLYTAQEKAIWEGRRPATVMVENNVDARPINGLTKADFVYEAVAEGGITRFMAVFYCGTAAEDVAIAPIRSSRFYFINWASEYGDRPLYVHVGGANDYGANGGSKPAGEIDPEVDALGLLQKIGWRVPGGNDIDNSFDTSYPVLAKNPERNSTIVGHLLATEHTTFLSTDELYKNAETRGLAATAKNGVAWTKGFIPYNFINDAKISNPTASDIKFDFWTSQPDYAVEWKYDAKNNNYARFNGGKAFTDISYNNIQVTAKNIVVMQVDETGPVDTEGHMIEENVGTGKAIVFQNGTLIQATWTKTSRTDRTKFTDSSGKEIPFVRGLTWVEAIPSGNSVNYN
ncbi:DUF3048 domain-containing protein [soil metagenome]